MDREWLLDDFFTFFLLPPVLDEDGLLEEELLKDETDLDDDTDLDEEDEELEVTLTLSSGFSDDS